MLEAVGHALARKARAGGAAEQVLRVTAAPCRTRVASRAAVAMRSRAVKAGRQVSRRRRARATNPRQVVAGAESASSRVALSMALLPFSASLAAFCGGDDAGASVDPLDWGRYEVEVSRCQNQKIHRHTLR